jgi:RNA recognition motif-containing protein
LFVPRIPDEVTEREVMVHFGAFGEVNDLYFPKFPNGARRGFCYVGFATAEGARRALDAALANPTIAGFRIGDVVIASRKDDRR